MGGGGGSREPWSLEISGLEPGARLFTDWSPDIILVVDPELRANFVEPGS